MSKKELKFLPPSFRKLDEIPFIKPDALPFDGTSLGDLTEEEILIGLRSKIGELVLLGGALDREGHHAGHLIGLITISLIQLFRLTPEQAADEGTKRMKDLLQKYIPTVSGLPSTKTVQ